MGSLNTFKNKFTSSNKGSKGRNVKTKGDRLGWASVNTVETVDLKRVLTNGEVVKLNQDNRPMLVP